MGKDCGKCGFANAVGRFCSRCGTPTGNAPPAATSSAVAPKPSLPSGHRAPGHVGGHGVALPRATEQRSAPTSTAPSRRISVGETLAGLQNPSERRAAQQGDARSTRVQRQMAEVTEELYGQTSETMTPVDRSHARDVASRTDSSSVFAKPVTMSDTPPKRSWYTGPANTDGTKLTASDRNLLCMDVRGDSVVVGSADHGLKQFNLRTGRETRTLYTKRYGHSEWVTACAFLSDGRVLSAGMDSKLCLWHASAVRCDDLLGHTGSVSQVAVNAKGMAVSAAYDRTLRVWDCNARGNCLQTLSGHSQPVTQFIWYHSVLMSGDRGGGLRAWDLDTNTCTATLAAKGGQIGALGFLCDDTTNIVFAGDQTGTLKVWDLRVQQSPVFDSRVHPGGVLSGAKGSQLRGNAPSFVATGGADKRLCVLDPRASFRPRCVMDDHKDFIYSLETYEELLLSGGGNGWLLVHDSSDGKCLYGLGANEAAVRNVFAAPEMLVCSGDDGSVMVYNM